MTILQEYDKKYHSFKLFEGKMKHLINDLLQSKNIKVHNISTRIKERASLEKKISLKNKYKKIEQITDIIGLRIITFFEDEVDVIAKLISEEFVIDKQNSVDKRVVEYDKFGYSSLHYVVTINAKRAKLLEYKDYKTQKMEIQIRSILQHAWAEIEHDFGYKSKTNIPDVVKRNFSRVAALLETSDLEFTKLRLKLNEYEKEIEQKISQNPIAVDINDISLESFIVNNKLVLLLDKEIARKTNTKLNNSVSDLDTSNIPKLAYLNITNINQLDTLLEQRKKDIVKFAEIFNEIPDVEGGFFSRGISIFYLCYLLIAERNNLSDIKYFVHTFWDANDHQLADELMSTYKKLMTQ